MFIPTLNLTKADTKRLGELAVPYFGKDDCTGLAKEAESMFARRAPWSDIRVAKFPSPAHLADTQIRLGIFIDFHLPQAVFLTKAADDA
jgi:hypothetical protein